MDKNISFEEFRKKGREMMGMSDEKSFDLNQKLKKRALADRMKKAITDEAGKIDADDETRKKMLGAINKLMNNSSE